MIAHERIAACLKVRRKKRTFAHMEKDNIKNMNIYQTLAVFVHGFFEAFAMGVLDDACCGMPKADRLSRKNVKQTMLAYYEHIGSTFFDQMFYAVAQLAYDDAEAAVAEVRLRCGSDATIPDYMRVACREQSVYDAMLAEYKRDFGALLSGVIPSAASHVADRVRGDGEARIGTERAIRLLVRIVVRTYIKALRMSDGGQHRLDQVSLVSMLASNLCLLVHDSAIDGDFNTLDELLAYVCGGEANYAVMTEELNSAMSEQLGQQPS